MRVILRTTSRNFLTTSSALKADRGHIMVSMRIQRLVVAVSAALVCALPTGASQSALTEDEYEAAMTEINFLVGDAELHIDARYWPDLTEDIRKLRTQFEQVEAFWTARGSEEAAGYARQVREGLSPILKASGERDVEAASTALRALNGTCQLCHDSFREPGPDGYRIKP